MRRVRLAIFNVKQPGGGFDSLLALHLELRKIRPFLFACSTCGF